MTQSKDEILDQLRKFNALKEGHFLLASGKCSEFYVQTAQITQYPHEVKKLIANKLAEIDKNFSFDTIFAPAIGALPLAQIVGEVLQRKTIFSERNAENKMELRRGFELLKGEKLLLVEDVVTTGGTLFELKKIIEDAGAEIVAVFALINRSGKKTWDDHPFEALVEVEFPTYEKEDCPMCAKGLPCSRPGTKIIKI